MEHQYHCKDLRGKLSDYHCCHCRFQFILIVPALFVEFFDRASAFRGTIMLLLAINTVLSILQVEKYLDARDNNEIQRGSRVNATIAGQCESTKFSLGEHLHIPLRNARKLPSEASPLQVSEQEPEPKRLSFPKAVLLKITASSRPPCLYS